MLYHSHSTEQALDSLKSSTSGLSRDEAENRQHRAHKRQHRKYMSERWQVVSNIHVVFLLVILLTTVVAAVYISELAIATVLFITLIIYASLLVILAVMLRKRRTVLDSSSQHVVKVLRDGMETYLLAKEIVIGDVVFVKRGDSIYHTGRIIEATELYVDELTATGNERLSKKQTHAENSHTPREMRRNMIYEGSHVTQGSGVYVVTAVEHPALQYQHTISPRMTSLYDKKATFVALFVFLSSLSLAIGVFYYYIIQHQQLIPEYLLLFIAVAATSTLNIIFVARSVVLLHLGILGKQNLQVPSLLSLEKLHALKNLVITTKDITTPQLYVHSAITPRGTKLSHDAIADVIVKHDNLFASPSDSALAKHIDIHATRKPLVSLPFDHRYQLSGNIQHHAAGYQLHIKGNPDKILERTILSEKNRELAERHVLSLASEGYHVLAIASTTLHEPIANFADLPTKAKFDLLGFVALERELISDIAKNVNRIRSLQTDVRLQTNEHPEAAYHIAKSAGIASHIEQVWSAHYLHKIPAHILDSINDLYVFSRASPDQVEQLISALKYQGLVGATLASSHHSKKQVATLTISAQSEPQNIKLASELLLEDTKLPTIYQALQRINITVVNLRIALYISVMMAGILVIATYILVLSSHLISTVYLYISALAVCIITPILLLIVIRYTTKSHERSIKS